MLFTCEGPLCAGISAFWALAAPRAGTVGSSEAQMVVFDSPWVDVAAWEFWWCFSKGFGCSLSSSESLEGIFDLLDFWLKIALTEHWEFGFLETWTASACVTALACQFWSGSVVDEMLEKLLEGICSGLSKSLSSWRSYANNCFCFCLMSLVTTGDAKETCFWRGVAVSAADAIVEGSRWVQ